MNKIVHVPAYFASVGKEKTVKVPTGETKTGFFGGEKEVVRKEKQWVQTGFSDSVIDSARLADDLERSIADLNSAGYEVISVTPMTSGSYDWKCKVLCGGNSNNGYGGYGYGTPTA